MASRIVLITGTKQPNSASERALKSYSNLGANSGIGFGITQVLAQASSDFHIILACRSLDKAQAAQSEIEATGIKGTLSSVQLDVTKEDTISNAAKYVQDQFGQLDVLVNNAGVGGLAFTDTKSRFQACLETNVIGPVLVSEAFRPLLFKSDKPYSIFVGSGLRTLARNALQKMPNAPPHAGGNPGGYQVSKAALNMLALLEARDYGEQGLKVFILSPGFIRSNLRGPGEDAISGWGQAGDAAVPGGVVLDIVEGKRDADVARLIDKDTVHEW